MWNAVAHKREHPGAGGIAEQANGILKAIGQVRRNWCLADYFGEGVSRVRDKAKPLLGCQQPLVCV
jgi:hypothetical protein